MASITIKIDTANAAFEDNPFELAAILEEMAARIRDGQGIKKTVWDSNGNTVGYVTVRGKRREADL